MIPYYDDGQVTIYCGDCRDVLPTLPNDMRPDLVLTDPPYPVSKFGRHDNVGEMVGAGDPYFLLPAFIEIERVMRQHSFCVSFFSWRRADTLLYVLRATNLEPSGHIVWVKSQIGLGSYLRSKHECAYLLVKGSPKPRKVIADVLEWRRDATKDHPTQKPVMALSPVIDALGATVVLDPFMGSGSTLLAAQQAGIRAVGIELEERYCEAAARRLQQFVMPLEIPA